MCDEINEAASEAASEEASEASDPYKPFKDALAAGKTVEYQTISGAWKSKRKFHWIQPPDEYRIKPDTRWFYDPAWHRTAFLQFLNGGPDGDTFRRNGECTTSVWSLQEAIDNTALKEATEEEALARLDTNEAPSGPDQHIRDSAETQDRESSLVVPPELWKSIVEINQSTVFLSREPGLNPRFIPGMLKTLNADYYISCAALPEEEFVPASNSSFWHRDADNNNELKVCYIDGDDFICHDIIWFHDKTKLAMFDWSDKPELRSDLMVVQNVSTQDPAYREVLQAAIRYAVETGHDDLHVQNRRPGESWAWSGHNQDDMRSIEFLPRYDYRISPDPLGSLPPGFSFHCTKPGHVSLFREASKVGQDVMYGRPESRYSASFATDLPATYSIAIEKKDETMNHDRFKKALKKGHKIRCLLPSGEWKDLTKPKWDLHPSKYRALPKPTKETKMFTKTAAACALLKRSSIPMLSIVGLFSIASNSPVAVSYDSIRQLDTATDTRIVFDDAGKTRVWKAELADGPPAKPTGNWTENYEDVGLYGDDQNWLRRVKAFRQLGDDGEILTVNYSRPFYWPRLSLKQ